MSSGHRCVFEYTAVFFERHKDSVANSWLDWRCSDSDTPLLQIWRDLSTRSAASQRRTETHVRHGTTVFVASTWRWPVMSYNIVSHHRQSVGPHKSPYPSQWLSNPKQCCVSLWKGGRGRHWESRMRGAHADVGTQICYKYISRIFKHICPSFFTLKTQYKKYLSN